jgi:hypothetical protein
MALLTAAPASAEKRVALVIGNGAYKAQGRLDNPPNDARLIGQVLAGAGFATVETKMDVGITEFRQSLRRFQSQANGAEVALVYFAGHGIEAGGTNWLIPTDAELAEDRDLEYEAIKSDLMLQALRGARMRVLVLDACRNNPFGRSWRTGVRSSANGLAKLEADDVLVLFAAAPGQTASDGTGGNSPFASALAKHLPEPGLAIQLLGGKVRDDVLVATGGNQRPYVSASITGQPFYLVPGEAERKAQDTAEKGLNPEEKKYFDGCVKLPPHLSRGAIVARLAQYYKAGSHTYGWQYDPPAPQLSEGEFPIASAQALPDGVLLINYNFRWGRLFLVPVTLAPSGGTGGATRGFRPRDTSIEGASIQLHGMWIQESGYGCANFYFNGETGEAAGSWVVADDAGKPQKSVNRIKKAEQR